MKKSLLTKILVVSLFLVIFTHAQTETKDQPQQLVETVPENQVEPETANIQLGFDGFLFRPLNSRCKPRCLKGTYCKCDYTPCPPKPQYFCAQNCRCVSQI